MERTRRGLGAPGPLVTAFRAVRAGAALEV